MKNIILFILLFLAIFAVYQYALPAWADISVLREKLKEVDLVEERIEDIAEERDKMIERLNMVRAEDRARLDALLPQKPDPEILYVFFENIVRKANMKPKNLTITVSQSDALQNGKKSIGFSMQVEGSYINIMTLLDLLENNIRLMDLRSLVIKGSGEAGKLIVDMQGAMYYGS